MRVAIANQHVDGIGSDHSDVVGRGNLDLVFPATIERIELIISIAIGDGRVDQVPIAVNQFQRHAFDTDTGSAVVTGLFVVLIAETIAIGEWG